ILGLSSVLLGFVFSCLIFYLFSRNNIFIGVQENLKLFLKITIITFSLLYLFLNFNILMDFFNKDNKKINNRYILIIILRILATAIILLFFSVFLYEKYSYMDFITLIYYSYFFEYLFLGVVVSLLISTKISKFKEYILTKLKDYVLPALRQLKNKTKLSYGYLFFISPAVGFIIMESLNLSTFDSVDLDFIFINFLLYEIIHVFFYIIFRRIKLTSTISLMLIYFIAIANYFVIDFKGIPIVFNDLLSINTAFNVSGAYEFNLNFEFALSMIIFISIMFVMMFVPEKKSNKQNNEIVKSLLILIVLLGINSFVYNSGFYLQDTSHAHWDPSMKFEKYGYLSSFIYDFKKSLSVNIDNYSIQDVEEILSRNNNNDNDTNKLPKKPNIIVVMNEAFSDLNIIGDFETNEDYIPYYRSLKDNTIKGILSTSPVRGSGTGFTEFEFLTGNTMAFLRGTNPYVQYINSETPSLVSTLKDQNYQALAMHPYKKTSYNRVSVYSDFGFDDFITMESFDDPETVRGNISDLENYKKVVELYEGRDKDKSFFIFNITMQNHGGYVDTGYEFNNPIKVTSFDAQEDVNVFLSLMKESDSALKYLIDYFENVEEDTLILVFGDHQPMLNNAFLENLYGKPVAELTLEEKSKLYQVPFTIWSNYDIDEKYIDNISSNYLSSLLLDTAGLNVTNYNRYLLNLQEKLPVVLANFYFNSEGKVFSYEDDSNYEEYLEEYEMIQYNNLFDLKNRLDKHFYIE
ncbi:MAG: LTA synthase family protein, partial [Eubacteriales bacterium]